MKSLKFSPSSQVRRSVAGTPGRFHCPSQGRHPPVLVPQPPRRERGDSRAMDRINRAPIFSPCTPSIFLDCCGNPHPPISLPDTSPGDVVRIISFSLPAFRVRPIFPFLHFPRFSTVITSRVEYWGDFEESSHGTTLTTPLSLFTDAPSIELPPPSPCLRIPIISVSPTLTPIPYRMDFPRYYCFTLRSRRASVLTFSLSMWHVFPLSRDNLSSLTQPN